MRWKVGGDEVMIDKQWPWSEHARIINDRQRERNFGRVHT